ncbi:MAG: tRNA preQ1(34) S-adenosylmethionine ribosyltransferase-isomerase QueA [Anaerolineae bacterium]|nr:tRNA preQ1(34) S-adenosylmethionine ribosyltransferase-isomerase QueA [Anaerolineae bacterium]
MKTADFDYDLPPELIAQTPLEPRDASRLLVLHRPTGVIEHRRFTDIVDYVQRGDIVVANDSRVLPARLFGRKTTGARIELLLLERLDEVTWSALAGGRRIREGTDLVIYNDAGDDSGVTAQVVAERDGAQRVITFSQPLDDLLDEFGHAPLPPYIHTPLSDPERYQTVYSRPVGSAAAPTAGLHFTPDVLLALRDNGVQFETTTLHVGLDTFKPVEAVEVADHHIHSEWAQLKPESAERINRVKLAGGRLVAVGTTATRVLETAALRSAGLMGSLRHVAEDSADYCPWKLVAAFSGNTDLFIYPGYKYRAVDAMLTNFHLPQSSLLMMIAAFAGYETIMHAYRTAIAERYRFYSFGDAMLIL